MTINNNFSQTAAFIWSVADLLRGDIKQSQYGRVVLPFTLLRRLECVLAPSKDVVVAEFERIKALNLPEDAQEKLLIRATKTVNNESGLTFFNTSPMDLGKMGQGDIKANLERYIQCFSADAREIFEHFKFDEFIGLLDDANLLCKVVKKFATTDLSPQVISNHDMGLVFEELIRRFAESSNETAGEHFTPRDIVRLTTSLVFMEDDDALTKEGIIRTIYDPTAGTGGFLSSGMEYARELNPNAVIRTFGQELNPESYAICKADMLIKGQDVSRIKLGNTLSNDQLAVDKFDYILSNPPFGVDWKKIEGDIKDEHTLKGFDGRFGAGLPRVSDATLLFLLHVISKLKHKDNGGSRAGIIVSGSCLFNGDAGSGESEIRRYIIECDLLESIVSLPKNMFFNTSVQPYILILNSSKSVNRSGKIQLIDCSTSGLNLKNRIGMKSVYLDDKSILDVIRKYSSFENTEGSKVVDSNQFKYRQVKVGLTQRNFEYERVPNNVDTELHLKEVLSGIYEEHKIDPTYTDHKDGLLGKLGVEWYVDISNYNTAHSERQFRHYFKECKVTDDWNIAISRGWKYVKFREQEPSKGVDFKKYYYFSSSYEFDTDYLRYFFNSDKWRDWLATYNLDGSVQSFEKYKIVRKGIEFPNISEQREIASILDQASKWKQKLTILETDLWREDKSDYSLERYRLPVDKDLHSRILDVAPYPLANLMHHYDSINEFDYKARYELLLKLFECLAIFSNSLALGFIEKELGSFEVLRILKSQKKFLKNATFGSWSNLLKFLKKEALEIPQDGLLIDTIFSEKLAELFDEAVIIRNETSGHGSYPTKSAARDTFKLVDNLYFNFLDMFYELFSDYCLVRPISGIWNGETHTYELEEYSGLGCYPFGLLKLSSKAPFVNDDLYFVSTKNNENKLKLFPFVRLIDLEEDSGLEAFYFYSKAQQSEINNYEFLFISHQQVHKQKQLHTVNRIEAIFS